MLKVCVITMIKQGFCQKEVVAFNRTQLIAVNGKIYNVIQYWYYKELRWLTKSVTMVIEDSIGCDLRYSDSLFVRAISQSKEHFSLKKVLSFVKHLLNLHLPWWLAPKSRIFALSVPVSIIYIWRQLENE